MPALPCEALAPQPCGHHSLGAALFSRASGRRLHVLIGLVLRDPPCRRCTLADQADHHAAVSHHACYLLTPTAVATFTDQVLRGQRVPLDQFHTFADRPVSGIGGVLPAES